MKTKFAIGTYNPDGTPKTKKSKRRNMTYRKKLTKYRQAKLSWQGGKSKEYDRIKQYKELLIVFTIWIISIPKGKNHPTKEWKEWRKTVFERDNFTCKDCNFRNGKGIKHRDLHPHHIKSATKYPKLIFKVSNGRTVCNKCHGKIHSKNFKNKKY